MKGIVLAGGLGTRLHPLTKITNKHLLPVYDRPMVFFPIQSLAESGIEEILLVTGGNNAGDFMRLLGTGRQFGLKHLDYTYQEGEGGIAEALGLAEHFAEGGPIMVILGDNVYEGNFKASVEAYRRQGQGGRIHLKEVDNPRRFGVAELEGDRVARILEKPAEPRSRYAVTGTYMYDPRVFDIIKTLVPSGRGELEITDVNNAYIQAGEMTYEILDGWWSDAGTFDSLLRTNILVAGQNGGASEEISMETIRKSAAALTGR